MAPEENKDENDIIKEGWIIIQIPSERKKLIQIKRDGIVSLGKFGSFEVNALLGKTYGKSYEIENSKSLIEVYEKCNEEDDEDELKEMESNNQEFKNNNTAQKLSIEELAKLKSEFIQGNMNGEEVISTIICNSESFDKRSDFSKQKYIQKKRRKFSRIFKPFKSNIKQVHDYFYQNNPMKVLDIRIDTLSQMMSLANIHYGIKSLVIDDAQGLIVGSVAEKMGGYGHLIALHGMHHSTFDIKKYLNLPCHNEDFFLTTEWRKLDADFKEEYQMKELETEDEELMQKRLQKRERYESHIRKIRQLITVDSFDCFIIASKYHPLSLVKEFSKYLKGSRPLVIYSQFKEQLAECFFYLRESSEYVNVQVTESWLREYQTLPGRMHPDMTTSANGGFILTATKIYIE